MASLASSGVTKIAEYYGNGTSNKRHVYRELQVVLSSMGTVANPIPAAALGLTKIKGSSNAVIADDSVTVIATPSYDGSLLLLKAAGTNAPADFTGTFRVTVWGATR